MSRITDYGFLFQTTFGTSKTNLVNNIQLSQMNSSSVQKQLKAAGIDTNSKKYKAALSEMMKNGNGAMFTNVQAIKNLMSQYDKNGDWIDPNTGLTGLAVTDENRNSYKHIISIPESSREEMFELAKKEFLNENGTLNGDTTKRESVYNNLYRKMDKDDRLSAGWTMEQYEHQYRQAFAEAAKAAPAPAAQAAEEKAAPKKTALELMDGDEVVKLAGMRKVVSERMTKSAQEIPTVTQNVRIDVTELMAFRKKINNDLGVKYSLNDYVLKATAKALKNNKHILVSLDGDQIIKRAHVNIGMAVALEDGLIVPVIKDADKMSLGEISEAARDLAERARTNKLSMDEYKGSTFSISNLGMFGVETFNPIINQPDAGILGVCAVQDELVMDAEGNITKRQFMRISFTFDHRLIDGATAAKFELAIRDLMEHPMQILL